jgi:hypothetical protein
MMIKSHVVSIRDLWISCSVSTLLELQTPLSRLVHLALYVLLNSAIYLDGYGFHDHYLLVDLCCVFPTWSFLGSPPSPFQESLSLMFCPVLALRIMVLLCMVALMVNYVHHHLYFFHGWILLYGNKKLAYTLLESITPI